LKKLETPDIIMSKKLAAILESKLAAILTAFGLAWSLTLLVSPCFCVCGMCRHRSLFSGGVRGVRASCWQLWKLNVWRGALQV
jgi:hypothetical protein